MALLQTLRSSILVSGKRFGAAGVIAAAALMPANGIGFAQAIGDVLPEGPRPRAELSLAKLQEGPGAADPESSWQSSSPPAQTSQPSPVAPSRVNPGSKATPGPLTQAERTQYVLRQLAAPEHLFGYSASALYHMADPPGNGSTYYPKQWRVGGPGFGRNFGDAAAEDQTKHVGKYVSGAVLREDPRYYPSADSKVARRAMHAVLFTLVDRSNDGARRPAISNLVGAAAGGYVGDAYLPPGFRNQAHATQRSLVNLAGFAGENVAAEFKPEIRELLRRLHWPFVK